MKFCIIGAGFFGLSIAIKIKENIQDHKLQSLKKKKISYGCKW